MTIRFGFSVERKGQSPAFFEQVHGNSIVEIADRCLSVRPKADGGFTFSSQKIHVTTADCIPLLLHGTKPSDPVMALHCGWRGARSQIVAKGLTEMLKYTEQIHAIVGPAILSCCFEVRQDFIDSFRAEGITIDPFLEHRNGKTFCNLLQFVLKTQLGSLPNANIHTESVRCTYCSFPRLPSYRRDGTSDPRIVSWIQRITTASLAPS